MGLINSFKRFKWGYLILSILLCAVGLCFIIYPTQSLNTTSFIIGGVALAAGVVQIVKILADRRRGFGFAISIIVTIATIICATVAFLFPIAVIKVYPMIIGLMIIIDGSFKLQTVINAKRYSMKMWWFLLILCSLAIIGGFLLIRLQYSEENAKIYTAILGISIFISGLQNFFSLFYLGRITKRAFDHIEKNDVSDFSTEDTVIADSTAIDKPNE